MKRLLIASIATMALQAVVPSSSSAAPSSSQASYGSACTRSFTAVRVCTAYVANASLVARVSYYKFGRSSSNSSVRSLLKSRYRGAAFAKLTSQTANWPRRVKVSLPRIRITSVHLTDDGATLNTSESWLVRSRGGKTLFRENRQMHTITMSKVDASIGYKYVVTNIA